MRALVLFSVLVLHPIQTPAQSHGLLQIGSVTVAGTPSNTQTNVTSNHYVFHGGLLQVKTATDSNNDLTETSYTYGPDRQLQSSLTISSFQDGSTSYTRTNYLNLGPFQRQALVTVASGPGSPERLWLTSTTTSNEHGDPISSVDEFDWDGDGVLDTRLVSTWEYDYANQQMLFTQNQDWNADGVFDTDSRLDYTLDKSGHPLSWKGHLGDSTGQPGGLFASGTFTYDKFGNLLEEQSAILIPGAYGASRLIRTTTYIYAHRGEVIRNAGHTSMAQ